MWAGQTPADASTAGVRRAGRMKGRNAEPQVQFDVRFFFFFLMSDSWTVRVGHTQRLSSPASHFFM